MKFKNIKCLYVFLILVTLSSLLLAGCSTDRQAIKKEQSSIITFTDDSGTEVSLKLPVKRIVSLAPANTETIYKLGAQDKLVGVTDYCDYPEKAGSKQSVGDFINPNVELIVSLNPDVVLATSGIQENTVSTLRSNGIEVVVIAPKSIKQLKDDFILMGKITGKLNSARKIVEELENTVENIEIDSQKKKKVFLEINSSPLMTAGKDTFVSDLISKAGGINIGDRFGTGYPTVNPEQLIKSNPEVYLISEKLKTTKQDVSERPGYSNMSCIKNNRVFVLENDDVVFRPGPRITKGLTVLNELINK